MLGLDKGYAEVLTQAVDTFCPPFIEKKTVLRAGLEFGLKLADTKMMIQSEINV